MGPPGRTCAHRHLHRSNPGGPLLLSAGEALTTRSSATPTVAATAAKAVRSSKPGTVRRASLVNSPVCEATAATRTVALASTASVSQRQLTVDSKTCGVGQRACGASGAWHGNLCRQLPAAAGERASGSAASAAPSHGQRARTSQVAPSGLSIRLMVRPAGSTSTTRTSEAASAPALARMSCRGQRSVALLGCRPQAPGSAACGARAQPPCAALNFLLFPPSAPNRRRAGPLPPCLAQRSWSAGRLRGTWAASASGARRRER